MFQELQSEYYEGVNHPEVDISGYCCDRCKVQPLTEQEYIENFMKNEFRYCNECRCFMKIQKFKCIYCLKEWTHRGERLLPLNCSCGGLVVWQK